MSEPIQVRVTATTPDEEPQPAEVLVEADHADGDRVALSVTAYEGLVGTMVELTIDQSAELRAALEQAEQHVREAQR